MQNAIKHILLLYLLDRRGSEPGGLVMYMKLYMAKLNREAERSQRILDDTQFVQRQVQRRQVKQERGGFHFGASLSTEAQYAMLKCYDDVLQENLEETSDAIIKRPITPPAAKVTLNVNDAKLDDNDDEVFVNDSVLGENFIRKMNLSDKFQRAKELLESVGRRKQDTGLHAGMRSRVKKDGEPVQNYLAWSQSLNRTFTVSPTQGTYSRHTVP